MERHIFVVRSRAAANKGLKEMAVVGYLNICASIKFIAGRHFCDPKAPTSFSCQPLWAIIKNNKQ